MKLKEGFSLRQVGDENIVVATGNSNVDFSCIISLNQSATRIWQAVQNKNFTVKEVSDLLCEWYEVGPDIAMEDANALVKKWQEAGLAE